MAYNLGELQMEAGFKEIEHTADWELKIWAPDLEGLLESAARGMYSLSHASFASKPREQRVIIIPIVDSETLIVDFLSELLFFADNEGIGFDKFQVRKKENFWQINLEGAPIQEWVREIKAVTFHGIHVKETNFGLEVNIVFDV